MNGRSTLNSYQFQGGDAAATAFLAVGPNQIDLTFCFPRRILQSRRRRQKILFQYFLEETFDNEN